MSGSRAHVSRHDLARPGRLIAAVGAALVLAASVPSAAQEGGQQQGRRGGRLVASLRAEPKTLNPVVAVDGPSRTVVRRMHADLVHINRASLLTEPALAESWSVSEDRRRFTARLREGVRFSDGHPVDADDVLFSFGIYLDETVGSPGRDLLIVGGEPIAVHKLDARTVELELAAPYAVAERLFDSFVILPEHRLRPAYEAGKIAEAWSLDTPPDQLVGLGPFRLKRYLPGERIELERNPHYWKHDASGSPLPYLDELIFLFVPSEDAEAIRFRAGEIDVVDGLEPSSFAALEGGQEAAGLRLIDLGPGLSYHFLFFNLNDLPVATHPARVLRQTWFRNLGFRRAVSGAIDRRALAQVVYGGRATPISTHVSPGNRLWHNAELALPERDVELAVGLLRAEGFAREPSGALLDSEGHPVRFTLLTNSSNRQRVEMATLIQEDLRQLGMTVQVVALEFRALVDRVLRSLTYDACLLGLAAGDADPNPDMGVWLSASPRRLWRLADEEPATRWEAEMDHLYREQLVTLDYRERRRRYDRIQEIVAENLPVIFLVAPNVLVGAKAELGSFKPAILDHHTLWNVEQLFWRQATSP